MARNHPFLLRFHLFSPMTMDRNLFSANLGGWTSITTLLFTNINIDYVENSPFVDHFPVGFPGFFQHFSVRTCHPDLGRRYFQAQKRTALRKRCSYVDSAKALPVGVGKTRPYFYHPFSWEWFMSIIVYIHIFIPPVYFNWWWLWDSANGIPPIPLRAWSEKSHHLSWSSVSAFQDISTWNPENATTILAW